MADPQTNGTAAPANGAKNGTSAPAPAAAPPSATPDPTVQLREQLKKLEGERDLAKRETVVGRRQWDAEKKSFGEKLKLADEYARLKRDAGINPQAAARSLWGDKYLDLLNTVAANGGAPTAESVALEIERAEERAVQRLEARDAAAKKAQQEATQKAEIDDRNLMRGDAAVAYEALADEYPVFAELGDKSRVGQIVVSQMDSLTFNRYRAALRSSDTETCATLMRSALDKLEGQMLAIAERAAGHDKYRAKLSEKLTPPKTPGNTSPVVKSQPHASQQTQQPSQQGRRTLSNDLTGSTPGDAPKYRTDGERKAAALAKYAELTSKQ